MFSKPTPFEINNDRFYYEPRVLWSVARVGNTLQTQSVTQPKGFVKMDKGHFQNGGKYPIRITHAIVSPVGYLLRDVTASTAARVDQCMAGLGRIKMRISFPKSSWIERLDTDVYSFGNVPVGEPTFNDDPDAFIEDGSGLFGVSRWTFDPSYILPQKATINLELSAIQSYGGVLEPVTASMVFHERGGRMLGHGRHRAPQEIEGSPSVFTADGVAWPGNHVPVIGDQFAIADGAAGKGPPPAFPPTGKWPSNVYNHQLGSRGLPYTEVTGFAVALEQILIDNSIHAQYGAHAAPISQRIITKAKTRDAGTQQPWWRDGAPLSLVTPTMNNAGLVHKWEQPFELGPGEYMEVSLQAPPTRSFAFGQNPPVQVDPIYNVGVSFLGYAVVEDNSPKVYRSNDQAV